MFAVTKPSSLMKHAVLYRMNLGNMTTPEDVLPPLGYRARVAVFCTPSQHNSYCFELVSARRVVCWMDVDRQQTSPKQPRADSSGER